MPFATGTPKVSVITGGAGGMGLATAKIVGRDHTVLLTDIRQERLEDAAAELRRQGISCETAVCDVANRATVEALVPVATGLGRVVSVIHTAGKSPHMGSAEEIIRTNALGTVHVYEAFLPVARSGFALVNVASSAGHLARAFPAPKHSYRRARHQPERFAKGLVARTRLSPAKLQPGLAYAISKNFVLWFTRDITADLGRRGARVVSVSPGSFDTDMGRLEASGGAGELAKRSALQRFGRVEEVAEVLAFAASDKAGYLTGTDILVDGGAAAVTTLRDTLAIARQGGRDR